MKKSFYSCFFKRFLDFLIALIAIIILSPVFLIVFIISKISFKGEKVIFTQYRPGKNGKIFKLYKFKSMKDTRDENGALLPDHLRVTTWGKIIRKTSLDELPQLFNILKGDMSIVGPRPRLVKDMVFYDKEVLKAYCVRPGLTGPTQVYDRDCRATWQEIFKYDLDYSEHISFFRDLKLFFLTFISVFKGGSTAGVEDKNKKPIREYYYADLLLKTNQITQSEYDDGIQKAENIIKNKSKIGDDFQDLNK